MSKLLLKLQRAIVETKNQPLVADRPKQRNPLITVNPCLWTGQVTVGRHFLQAYKFVFLHFYIPISETYISLFLFLDPSNSASFWVECCQSLPSCNEGLLVRFLLHPPAINRFPLRGTWWSGLPQQQRQPWLRVIFFLAVTRITI